MRSAPTIRASRPSSGARWVLTSPRSFTPACRVAAIRWTPRRAGTACARPTDRTRSAGKIWPGWPMRSCSSRTARPAAVAPAGATAARVTPRGYGGLPPGGGGRVYGGGPRVGVGVGVMVPLEEPVYTHEGAVADPDDTFAGDQAYVAMTLVSSYDG